MFTEDIELGQVCSWADSINKQMLYIIHFQKKYKRVSENQALYSQMYIKCNTKLKFMCTEDIEPGQGCSWADSIKKRNALCYPFWEKKYIKDWHLQIAFRQLQIAFLSSFLADGA